MCSTNYEHDCYEQPKQNGNKYWIEKKKVNAIFVRRSERTHINMNYCLNILSMRRGCSKHRFVLDFCSIVNCEQLLWGKHTSGTLTFIHRPSKRLKRNEAWKYSSHSNNGYIYAYCFCRKCNTHHFQQVITMLFCHNCKKIKENQKFACLKYIYFLLDSS